MKLYGPRTNIQKRKKVKKMKYFKLEEFLDSSVARQKGISNLPSWEIIEHLKELSDFLDDMREAWGSGINVTSGFRCEKLNKAVGGVPTSLHLKGYAADLQPANGKLREFKSFVVEYLKDKVFDECILERKGKTEWVHLQLFSNQGYQRKKVFSLTV